MTYLSKKYFARAVGSLLLLGSSSAYAVNSHQHYAQNDFGGVGLIQTPTARMKAQGENSINYSDTDEYRRSSVSLQVFARLSATARDIDILNRLYCQNPAFGC